jgi:hypothetical protein
MEVGMVIVSSPPGTTGLATSNAATTIQELVRGNQSGGVLSSYNDSMAAEHGNNPIKYSQTYAK